MSVRKPLSHTLASGWMKPFKCTRCAKSVLLSERELYYSETWSRHVHCGGQLVPAPERLHSLIKAASSKERATAKARAAKKAEATARRRAEWQRKLAPKEYKLLQDARINPEAAQALLEASEAFEKAWKAAALRKYMSQLKLL